MDQSEVHFAEPLQSEHEHLDHINEEYNSENNINKTVDDPLAPNVPKASTGANECPKTKYPDPLIKYHFKFEKADDTFIAGTTCMYWKLELLSPMQDLQYDGINIARPAGTIFRPGDEVFLHSKRRITAEGIKYIIFGIFPDVKTPLASAVLLIDEKASLLKDNVKFVFRSAPLNYVGLVPDGKCIDTTKPLLQQVEPLCKHLFQNVFKPTDNNPLASLDFYQPNKQTEVVQRPKRSSAGRKKDPLAEHQLQGLRFQSSLRSESLPATNRKQLAPVLKLDSGSWPLAGTSTPPCIKRIEKKVDALVQAKEEKKEKELAHLKKSQAQVAKLSAQVRELQQKNTQLGDEIGDAACKVAENQLLMEENIKLKDEVGELKTTISAQNHEIEVLKIEMNVLKKTLKDCLKQSRNDKKSRKRTKHERSVSKNKKKKRKYVSDSPGSDTDSNSSTSNSDSS
jgi:hypothetical protein